MFIVVKRRKAEKTRNPIENSLTDMQGEKKGDEKDEEQNRGSEPTGIHLAKDTKGDQKDEELRFNAPPSSFGGE